MYQPRSIFCARCNEAELCKAMTKELLEFVLVETLEDLAENLAVLEELAGQIEDLETGLIVEPGDASSLAAALLELVNSPKKRLELGQKAQRRALAVFDANLVARQTLDLYCKL